MVKVVWTDVAMDDLKFIHEHISRDSKFYADRFIDKLLSRVGQLEKYPDLEEWCLSFKMKLFVN